eukprot:scaffold1019_cov255-Pinguiococcus_pyrenoidosus.AAC.8
MDLDIAPPFGLYLERPYFEAYNKKLDDDRSPLAWHTSLDGDVGSARHASDLVKTGELVDSFRIGSIEGFILAQEREKMNYAGWMGWLCYK